LATIWRRKIARSILVEVYQHYDSIEKEIITWSDLEKTIKSKVLILSKIRKDRKR